MKGTAYLLHLEPGLPVTAGRVARHNLGFTEGEVTERTFERALKLRHETPRQCPRYVNSGHTNGRGLLLQHTPAITAGQKAAGVSV